jgi:hypothetical protein
MFKEFVILFVGIMFAFTQLSAETKEMFHNDIKTPFNLNRVIEQVSHHPVRDGENIVINDREYRAIFKDGEIILKAAEKTSDAKDIIISIDGEPEIKGNSIIYRKGFCQEISFEGTDRGIRYRESNPLNQQSIMGEYKGDIAREEERYNKYGENNGEFLIDTSIVYVGAAYDQKYPSIAYDGINYFIVWQDFRNGSADIYGARVTSSGELLDTAGINISKVGYCLLHPSIAYNGTNYLVVWIEYYHYTTYDIYGTRVTPSGEVLDTSGIPISTAVNNQYYPSIASDGIDYLVVWYDDRGLDRDIYGARVSQSGEVLDTLGIPISTAVNNQSYPSIAFDGTNYLVVWDDYRSGSAYDIYGARVRLSGEILDTSGIPISTAVNNQSYPSIAFDGINYFIVWHDDRGLDRDIYGAMVSQSGEVLDTLGIPISTETLGQSYPSIASDGTNYLVVWHDYRSDFAYDIYGARVTSSGEVLDTAGIPISTAANWQSSPTIAFDGLNYLVVWQDDRSLDRDIYGARVTFSGEVLDTSGIPISKAASYQSSPSIVSDGTNYFIVWEDNRNGSDDIYGARVTPSGTVLEPGIIPISEAEGNQEYPSIAYDGTNFLVVWQDSCNGFSDIYGTRVTSSGEILDTSGIPISTAANNQYSPFIAFDGANYLVVWEDNRSGSNDIYGARVTQLGEVLDTSGIPISTAINNQYYPSIASDGANFLIVWYDNRNGSYDIYGARVTPSGEVLDTSGIPISKTLDEQFIPSITYDGANYLVVWEDDRNLNYDIYGARVSPSGEVLDTSGIPISTEIHSQYYPSIAFDGTNYFIIWQDARSGYSFDIYGAKVSTDGTVIDSFPISTQQGNQHSPAIARGSGDQVLVVYSGWAYSVNGCPVNIHRIWGKFSPFTGIKENKNAEVRIRNSKLMHILPNPFGREILINYSLDKSSNSNFTHCDMRIYDVSGKLIKTLINGNQESGHHSIKWDGTIKGGRKLSSGVYFIRFESGNHTETEKIYLIK